MLRPDDTLHFFTSPYRRTRETTEGILTSLTADDPAPSPFPRNTIKVYEEPRLREQDFGNFQPCSAAMEKMWQERADYGHFFYRIPNGESAADAYDRVSGFNESLWRLFGEDDFASVCVLVTHGLMTRIFLMKWYHFSVEYFEDLRNINHCEFVVMKKNTDNGKYILQNHLRTWSELKMERDLDKQREKAAREAAFGTDVVSAGSVVADTPTIPIRRQWGGCPDGCNHGPSRYRRKLPPASKQSAQTTPEEDTTNDQNAPDTREAVYAVDPIEFTTTATTTITTATHHQHRPSESELTRGLAILQLGGGRDAGGSRSGATSRASFTSTDGLDNLLTPSSPPLSFKDTTTAFPSSQAQDAEDPHDGQTPRPQSIPNFTTTATTISTTSAQQQQRSVPFRSRSKLSTRALANSLGDTDDNNLGLASRLSSDPTSSEDEHEPFMKEAIEMVTTDQKSL